MRSLIIYYFTPMVTSGIMPMKEVNNLELSMRERALGIPKDIRRDTCRNVLMMDEESLEKVIRRIETRILVDSIPQEERQ